MFLENNRVKESHNSVCLQMILLISVTDLIKIWNSRLNTIIRREVYVYGKYTYIYIETNKNF